MGTTNKAEQKGSNIFNICEWYDDKSELVNSGNKKSKNNSFYDTYVLPKLIANVALRNYYNGMAIKGEYIDGSLEADKDYTVYGHPNKYVYDYAQKWNNCGVVSTLNLLSVAGVKNISQLTKADMEHNETVRENMANTPEGEFYSGPSLISKSETESSFTLWAIQNSENDLAWYFDNYNPNAFYWGYYDQIDETKIDGSFCLHYNDYTTYKNASSILFIDGGTLPFQIKNMLDYHGKTSEIQALEIEKYCGNNYKTAPITTTPGGDLLSVYMDGKQHVFTEATPINNPLSERDGEYATDLIIEARVQLKDVLNQTYSWAREGDDAIIRFSRDTGIKLTGYYNDDNEYSYRIKFEDEYGNLTEENVISAGTLEEYCKDNNLYVNVNSQPNRYNFDFVYQLEEHLKDGKGILLGGYANQFIGEEKEQPHAIAVTGVVISETGDVSGFMIVETGGFLERTDSAQFISAEMMYKFLTNDDEMDGERKGEIELITSENVTVNEIRSWSDKLNLTGNKHKNELVGNDQDNIINGKGGADIIYGGTGNDKLYGEAGNDGFYGEEGNDTIYGGAGNDKYIIKLEDSSNAANHDVIDVGSGRDELQFDDILSLENEDYDPTAHERNMEKIKNNFTFTNNKGNLIITYKTDIEKTIQKDPYIVIKDGEIVTEYKYEEIVHEIHDDNTITILNYFNKKKYDVLKQLKFSDDDKVSSIDFIADILAVGQVKYTSDENVANYIWGTNYADSIVGGNYADVIKADAGNDTIIAGAGNDTIYAGKGNDNIYASHGNDVIYNEKGEIKLHYTVARDEITGDFISRNYSGTDVINTGKGSQIITIDDETLDSSKFIFSQTNKDLLIILDETTGDAIKIKNYFSKKGKTSAQYIEIKNTDGSVNYIELVDDYQTINANKQNINDLLKNGGSGGLGEDTIYGTKNDDIISGGLNNDKLYGKGGTNKYMFEANALGDDTIYTTSKSTTIIDFTESEISFDNKGIIDGPTLEEYAYTKNKNDLIINYATTVEENGNAQITISNFFKSKDDFILESNNGTISLKEATIYFEGNDQETNKITGSNINDMIVGKELNDTLIGSTGSDTLIGNEGNDILTGGTGDNVIIYNIGDGFDTINLTKNENLEIVVNNIRDEEVIVYDSDGYPVIDPDTMQPKTTTKTVFYTVRGRIEGKNLIFYTINNYDFTIQDILCIKNFDSKDITTSNGGLKLTASYYDDDGNILTDSINLKEDIFLPGYENFTIKKNKYKGKWYSELIDASILNEQLISTSNKKGANINAGGGNDYIIGSKYSDTIKGGNGNDIIFTNQSKFEGKNTVDGGNGEDKYYLFMDRDVDTKTQVQWSYENSIIKDTGKHTEDEVTGDIAYINLKHTDLTIEGHTDSTAGRFWFNIDQKQVSNTINLYTSDKQNNATLTNIEQVYTIDGWYFDKSKVDIAAIRTFLKSKGYKDVNAVINSSSPSNREAILAYFAAGWTKFEDKDFEGTSKSESITQYGFEGYKTIYAYGGHDTITVYDGIESIYAGSGNDIIYSNAIETSQTIYGDSGSDRIINNGQNATIYGGENNDTIINYAHDVVIYGDDSISGSTGNNSITNNKGNRVTIIGSDGSDTIMSSGNATIKAGAGNDFIEGTGNNTIYFEAGYGKDTYTKVNDPETTTMDKLLFADRTIDDIEIRKVNDNIHLCYSDDSSDKVVIEDAFKKHDLISNPIIIGSDNTETTLEDIIKDRTIILTGEKVNNELYAGNIGKYDIIGGNGDDTIASSVGADTIDAGAGNDVITGTGNDLIFFQANAGYDRYYWAQDGNDTLSFTNVEYADMTLKREANDLIITHGEGNSLYIKEAFNQEILNATATIFDKNGEEKSIEDLISEKTVTVIGTEVKDVLYAGATGNYHMMGDKDNDAYHVHQLNGVTIEDTEGETDVLYIHNNKNLQDYYVLVNETDNTILITTTPEDRMGLTIKGIESIDVINVDNYCITKEEISKIKENISGWLTNHTEYSSIDEIFTGGNTTDINDFKNCCNITSNDLWTPFEQPVE